MMTRGEANTVCVGDKVLNLGGVEYEVEDLEFTTDSNGEPVILATIKNPVHEIQVNLELCSKAK